MGGIVKSVGGFLGFDTGDKAPEGQFGNSALSALNAREGLFHNADSDANNMANAYRNGSMGFEDAINNLTTRDPSLRGEMQQELGDQLATGATTGSKYATEQVMANPILGQLFGKGGQFSKDLGLQNDETKRLTDMQDQEFQLKPEDMTMYGQQAGNIARLFGQQGNQAAQDLASRGLASAPSGAAGALFSGIAGNQNEQLQKSMMDLMQQRFSNNMQAIGQQNQILSGIRSNNSQMGQLGESAINSQYQRQLAGAQHTKAGLQAAAGLQNEANNSQNNYNMQKAQFDEENKPQNFMDMSYGALGSMVGAAGKTAGNAAGQAAGKGITSMFGA